MNRFYYFLVFFFGIIIVLNNCNKEKEFLDAKPNQSLILPTSLGDFERLLNDQRVFNIHTDHSFGSASSDEYFVPDNVYNTFPANFWMTLYTWEKDIQGFEEGYQNEWNIAYNQIFYCNVVLEGIENLSDYEKSQNLYDTVKGRALFLRSWAFYNLVQTYAMPYNPQISNDHLGIPLRLSSDINSKSVRATVQECYDQIIADLNEALNLLPELSDYKTHPSGTATLGFLARIYLGMGNYEKAFEHANLFLSKYSILTDFNSLPIGRTASINTTFLDEDVFHTSINTSSPSTRSRARIRQSFYDSYNDNDLRKTLFFRLNNGELFFRGSYNQFGYPYSGIATDEIFLIRSECFARRGDKDLALNDLNHLLKFRWDVEATFNPIQADSAEEALLIVLEERKKELLFRGTRWVDLRRLNQELEFRITLRRVVNGVEYLLPPNDPRYALPIPQREIELSGLAQNQR